MTGTEWDTEKKGITRLFLGIGSRNNTTSNTVGKPNQTEQNQIRQNEKTIKQVLSIENKEI